MTFPAGAADAKPGIIELCYVRMRNTQDAMAERTNGFLAKSYFPALKRAGAKQVGAFTNMIGDFEACRLRRTVNSEPSPCAV